MKRATEWGGRSLRAIAVVTVGMVAAGETAGQCQYELTAFTGPNCAIFGPQPMDARGLSDTGYVVGWYDACPPSSEEIAYVWHEATGLVQIPFPAGSLGQHPQAVNDLGEVVGTVCLPGDGQAEVAFRYDVTTDELTILPMPPGGNHSWAVAINASGQIAGTYNDFIYGDPPGTPVIWSGDEYALMEVPFGPDARAADMNDWGHVVGWMGFSPSGGAHAFLWEDGTCLDLGVPPGAFSSQAMAINNLGQVIVLGWYDDPPEKRSFVWFGGAWTELGTLPGTADCIGVDINDAGQIVGRCDISMPFLWQDGVMTPLFEVVTPESSQGLTGFSSRAISQSGLILGSGGFQGELSGLRLAPFGLPSGDVNLDCHVDVVDFLAVLSSWGPCPATGSCPADVDDDGVVSTTDFLLVLGAWGLGGS